MKSIVIFALSVTAVAAFSCCPQPESAGKCDSRTKCCPDPCCCICTNITVPGTTAMMTPPVDITTTTSEICEVGGLDVVFVVDSSVSITQETWDLTMQFLADVVASDIWLEVGVKTRFSFIKFLNTATVVWRLMDMQSDSLMNLQQGFLSEPFERGFTNTPAAIDEAYIMLTRHDRNDTLFPDLAIVLTDGKVNVNQSSLPEVSERLQSEALVTVIGIGDRINTTELEVIATDGADGVFLVESFEALASKLEEIIEMLFVRICMFITASPTTERTTMPVQTSMPMVVESCECCCPPLPDPCMKKPYDTKSFDACCCRFD